MVGQSAVAETELSPEGWVRACGEKWKAVAEGHVAPGEKTTITSVDGLTLHVRKGD